MAMAAILVMWPGQFEQTFVPPSHRSSIWNLTLIGPVVSEEKMFKECGRRRTTMDEDVLRTTEAYLSYKLTIWAFGSSDLKKKEFDRMSHFEKNNKGFFDQMSYSTKRHIRRSGFRRNDVHRFGYFGFFQKIAPWSWIIFLVKMIWWTISVGIAHIMDSRDAYCSWVTINVASATLIVHVNNKRCNRNAYCPPWTISVAVATLIVHMDNKRWVDNKRRYTALQPI